MKPSRFAFALLVYIALSLTITPLPTPAAELIVDTFASQLGPGWSWLREHPGAWRISSQGLEVRVEPGNMWGPQNNAKNLLLRNTPDPLPPELSVSVTVENRPTHQYEQADLTWYYDDSHMVKIGQELVDGQRSIVMGREENDKTRTIAIIPLNTDSVRLQLVVAGNSVRGRFRPAGQTDWRDAGTCDLPTPSPAAKPKICLQFYQGAPDAEHWVRVTDFVVATPGEQDFSGVQIKTTPVAGGVYMLEGAGGNIAVLAGPDGLLMVDDQFAPLAPKIEAALDRLGSGKLKYLLNTHHHGDHTGGNTHFGRQAAIIAQDNVRKRLATGGMKVSGGLPVITFDRSLTVHFNDEEIRLIHLGPGHTDGDSIILFTRANVVHAGDQFFSGRFPNIDLGGGGDVRGYIRNVEELMRSLPPAARLIPGHGPLSTRKELEEFHEMLLATSRWVEQRIAAGKNLETIQPEGLPDPWNKWQAPTLSSSRWLEILYQGLKPR